jgi:hypothetical protein
MIKLTNLLVEGTTERRINLMRVEAVLENLAHHLSSKDQQKLAKVFVELHEIACSLNETPQTIFNTVQWKLLNMILAGKVAELRLIAEDIAEDNKNVDCWPLVKAIDTILTN